MFLNDPKKAGEGVKSLQGTLGELDKAMAQLNGILAQSGLPGQPPKVEKHL